ncbi:M23 family metallopeptidase [candidate division KSB1 bacterium]|nr:M23 family metallopeptidase [candidate division KSB1 bacterium]
MLTPKRFRNKKNLSILLIPDDDTEPFSFQVSLRLLRVLAVIGIVVIVHIVMGAIFYWRYAIVSSENTNLETQNQELLAYQTKTYQLWEELSDLERRYERIKNALGIKQPFDFSKFSHSKDVKSKRSTLQNIPGIRGEAEESTSEENQIMGDFDFMQWKKTDYHDFARRMPTLLPVNGYLSQDFRSMQWFSPADFKSHQGIDIVAKRGTSVKAAGDGIVVFANWTFYMGNLIILYHGSGFFSYYGHNDRLLVPEKSYVRKGDSIALLGNSGNSTDPHLHFEIWHDGEPVDPKQILLSFLRM